MSFEHRALNRLSLIAGIAVFLVAAEAVRPPSKTGHQLPDAGIGIASSHIVNRALKADKFMVAKPQAIEPGTPQLPRPDVRSSDIKIGCERPFSAMVSIRSDVAGRCIARVTRQHSSLA
jgi:hypothetical protein